MKNLMQFPKYFLNNEILSLLKVLFEYPGNIVCGSN